MFVQFGYTYVHTNVTHLTYIGVYVYRYIGHETVTVWGVEDVDLYTVGGMGRE